MLMHVERTVQREDVNRKFIPLVRFTSNEPVILNGSPVLTKQTDTGNKNSKQTTTTLPSLCAS